MRYSGPPMYVTLTSGHLSYTAGISLPLYTLPVKGGALP